MTESPSPSPPRIAAIGECMIELRHLSQDRLELAFGGDTLNTAVYLRRAGRARGLKVDYATALGSDPYSEAMRKFFERESLGLDLVGTREGRLPGLYAIRTDARGERSFFYWRREAAARAMFDGEPGAALAETLGTYDWLYLSGITLSILDAPARLRLIESLDRARGRGGKVAFDSNYRPRGWPSESAAREAFETLLKRTDIALPTFGDEQTLYGDSNPRQTVSRLHRLGVREVVVKDGDRPLHVSGGDRVAVIDPEKVDDVVDTTAAGDAFNGGYLTARIVGLSIDAAAQFGHRLAAAVVRHRGAIIPDGAMPPPL